MEELQDGDEGGAAGDGGEVGDGEEHGKGEGPGGQEADGDGAEDGDGDGTRGVGHFFSEVGGAVEAGEGVVAVDEADYECCFSLSVGCSFNSLSHYVSPEEGRWISRSKSEEQTI